MAYGDRINAIKQDWIDDINEILNKIEPVGELKSLRAMSVNDLMNLHTVLQKLTEK